MRSPLLTPRWLGLHLLVLLVVLGCFAGGYWQFLRAQEPDRDAVTNPAADLAGAVALAELAEPGEYMSPDEANRAVTATGSYDADAQLLVPRAEDGVVGFDVVVPLVTAKGTAVAVNRGWTGEAGGVPAPPGGEVTVTGWILPPQKNEQGFVPVEVPAGQVERIAPALLVNEWPYRLYEGYVTLPEQDPATAGLRPVPPPEPPAETVWNWRSLSYSAQWVVFGLAAGGFWISLMRREVRGDPQAQPAGTAS